MKQNHKLVFILINIFFIKIEKIELIFKNEVNLIISSMISSGLNSIK